MALYLKSIEPYILYARRNSKHSRKIVRTARNSKHTVGEKLKEIIIEVLIIVFAVTLSIWLHSRSEHNHQQEDVKKFLSGIKNDLKNDVIFLNKNKLALTNINKNSGFLQILTRTLSDSIIGPKTTFSLIGNTFNNARYEGFKSSGKIETIENDSVKNAILQYYQQTVPNLITSISFLNSLQLDQLKDGQNSLESISLYDYYNSKKVRSMLHNIEYNSKQDILLFEKAVDDANKLIQEIDIALK
ncbi:MAG: hypothetical protein WKF66_20740 [Pedobacter sp.]